MYFKSAFFCNGSEKKGGHQRDVLLWRVTKCYLFFGINNTIVKINEMYQESLLSRK